jgi:quercetin dioxygenase-like cupin family protein
MKLEVIRWTGGASPSADDLDRRLESEGFQTFRWQDSAGADYSAHSHDHDESLWLIDGEISFGIDGTDYRLRPGDRLMLPKDTVHTARAGAAGADYWIGQRG